MQYYYAKQFFFVVGDLRFFFWSRGSKVMVQRKLHGSGLRLSWSKVRAYFWA